MTMPKDATIETRRITEVKVFSSHGRPAIVVLRITDASGAVEHFELSPKELAILSARLGQDAVLLGGREGIGPGGARRIPSN